MECLRARRVVVRAITCALLVAGLSSPARADERTDARREFHAGMLAISDGKYDEGIEHLERAYAILPHPNVLYNIALAHMYAGRPEPAVELLQRYKEVAPPSAAREVEALITTLTPAPAGSTAGAATVESTGDTASGKAALEAAARAVRTLADEQDSEPLRRQASRLEEAAQRLEVAEASAPVPVLPAAAASPAQAAQAATEEPVTAAIVPQKPPIITPPTGTQESVYEERVVSASRISQSPLEAPNATAIITSQDIRMTGLVQLSHILRRVAGVEVNTVTPGHSEIGIRGLSRRSSNKVLLLWDGRQIRKDFNGANWIDMIPILVGDIERIEIIRGPASALYGADAFSGVINVITRAPGKGGSFAVARIGNRGQYQGGASFTGRTGAVDYRASAGYVQAENSVLAVGSERQDVRAPNDSPEQAVTNMFANGDVVYTYAEAGELSLGGNYAHGDYTLQGLSRLGQTVSTDAYEAQAYASLTVPGGLRLAANFNQVAGNPSAAWVAPGAVSDQPIDIRQRLLDLDLAQSTTGKLIFLQTLTVGVNYRFKHIEWDWLDDEHAQHHVGAYLQDVIQIVRQVKVQLGARIDKHPLLDGVQFSPRGSLIYRFLGQQSLRFSAGRAFRSPSFLESYLEIQNDTPLRAVSAWGKGNDDLDPESITSVELGYQNQQSDFFALEANVYHNWIRDTILLTRVEALTPNDYARERPLAGFSADRDAYPVSVLSFANERATYRQIGGELGVRVYPVTGVDLYTNYAIHDTSPLDQTDVDPERAREQQTSLHKVNGGFQYRAPFGLELSSDVSWFSSQRWIEQVADPVRGVRWQPYPQPSFVMLNARVGYRLLSERLELGVAGTNLAFQHKRQHPLAQPIDTRVLATAKVRF